MGEKPVHLDEILANFEFLDDWDDRYRYLIELGGALAPLSEAEHNAANKVQGCASQVWIVSEKGGGADPVLRFRGDSDAHIVRGLVAVVLALFSGKTASQIVVTDEAQVFSQLRLAEHISPQRSNGLRSMVARIKREAQQAMAG
jgi:cysteine desulfuration protein SufE